MTSDLTQRLLDWYQKNGRDLPWRFKGGAAPDPYPVWISEIMLQQTTIAMGTDYFLRWMKRFPTLKSLAEAPLDDVLKMWAGLGYYTRARKLYECAQILQSQYNGKFPSKREELLKLPGIGPYTASAICAFAFNQPETVVDGNVIRVMARFYGITTPIDTKDIYERAQKLTPTKRGADYASAIMDLGATVCKPTNPACDFCPWAQKCIALKKGLIDKIPMIQKPEKKKKTGIVFVIKDTQGRLFIQKRTKKGLLSGLWELPWADEKIPFPFKAKWTLCPRSVRHIFTHIDLTLKIYQTSIKTLPIKENERFVREEEIKNYAFSTLMKKVIKTIC